MKGVVTVLTAFGILGVGVAILGWPVFIKDMSTKKGSMKLMNRMVYMVSNPQIGDVVVYTKTDSPSIWMIGKVWAGPEDVVSSRGLTVSVETVGKKMDISALKNDGEEKEVSLKVGEYLVLGEEGVREWDLELPGVISRKQIIGKVW